MSAFDRAVNDLTKKNKSLIIQRGTRQQHHEKIPFSSPRANYMTYGGIPIGKATEFFGGEGGGKTTSALDIAGNALKIAQRMWEDEIRVTEKRLQDLEEKGNKSDQPEIKRHKERLSKLEDEGPRKVVFCDAENTLDEDWARLLGVDVDALWLMKPLDQTAEQVLEALLDLIRTGQVLLIVLDSVPMLVSQNVYEQTMEKKSYGGVAGAMSIFCAKASPLLAEHSTALIFINQLREDMENPYNQYKTPGGKALKHLYALRMFFRKGTFITETGEELRSNAEEPEGNLVDIHIVKTKVCKPNRRVGQYTLKYKTGIDDLTDTVMMAIKYRMIDVNGSWYTIIDPNTGEIIEGPDGALKFQGKLKLLEYLRDDEEIYGELYTAVSAKLKEAE